MLGRLRASLCASRQGVGTGAHLAKDLMWGMARSLPTGSPPNLNERSKHEQQHAWR